MELHIIVLQCMSEEMTRDEFLELYDDGKGDSYLTSWTD